MRRKSGKTLWAKKHSQGQRNELLRLMAFWHLGSGKAGLLKAACPPSAVTTEGDGLTDTKLHFSVLGYPSNPTQFSLGSVSDFMFSWAKLVSSTICRTLTHVTTERTSSKRLTQMQTKNKYLHHWCHTVTNNILSLRTCIQNNTHTPMPGVTDRILTMCHFLLKSLRYQSCIFWLQLG